MPSHTTDSSVGVAELGDGAKLTMLDRRSNDQADVLAKKAALTHRVPERIRVRLQLHRQVINETVRWIGQVNYEANKFAESKKTSLAKSATHLPKSATHLPTKTSSKQQ